MNIKTIAPAIIEYEFPSSLAEQILNFIKKQDDWFRSEVSHDIEKIQEIRTSSEINAEVLPYYLYNQLKDYVKECTIDYNTRFQCDITKSEGMSLLKYDIGNWYISHSDTNWKTYRVVSMIIYLNPSEYDGGATRFKLFNIDIKPQMPSLVLFPSNFAYEHEAMPVNNGFKYVIVSWMNDLPKHLYQSSMKDLSTYYELTNGDSNE